MTTLLTLAFLAQVLRISVPYVLAALGGTMSERAGVVNLALEGMLLSGAFCATVGASVGGAPVGALCGVAGGLLVAGLYALVVLRFGADQIVAIADGLANAEKGNRTLAEASAKSDEQLRAARNQAQDILSGANNQAGQMVEQARGTAQTEAERIKAAAHAEAMREVERVKEALRKQVGELAVAGAAQILKREIDAKAHADVIKELAAKI